MNIFLLAAMVLAALGGLFSMTRQIQMLQQNSYFPSRYSKWLSDNFPFGCFFIFFISSAVSVLEIHYLQTGLAILFLIFGIKSAFETQTKSIKKLVFTGRVKRLFGAAVVVFLALIVLYALFPETLLGKICSLSLFFLCFIPPVTVYICWALTLPIEKAFSAWYVSDAKKMLKKHSGLKVIGITGSYGKTTTKFILTRILSEKYNTVCTPHSFNTPMGVVRTIREHLKPQTEVFVCEMGAKKVGDIKEICDIVHPDYALITSVGPQHLDTFGSVDNVFKTKFELANAVAKKGAKAFVNGDSKELAARIENGSFAVYGTTDNCDYKAENISYTKNGCEFDLCLGDTVLHLTSRLLGLHSVLNIAGAAALAFSLGVSAKEIQYAVASLKPTEHRLELKSSVNGSIMIDDAYNSNPEGCLEAVRVLSSFEGMRKVIITPGLIELGDKEYESNYALGLESAKLCDIIIFVGANRSKPMVDAVNTTDFDKQNMFVAKSFFEAMDIYKTFADKNTVLLIENDLPDNYLN